jgi:hypothetical protein
MKCPNCNKSLWFVRHFCPFCKTHINAPPRPKSVTVLCGFFIVMGGLLALQLLMDAVFRSEFSSAESRHTPRGMLLYALPAFYLVVGGFTLAGQNWARWALVVWLGLNAAGAATLATDPKLICGSILLLIASAYYLFRPQARAFFRGEGVVALGPGASADG